MSSEKITTPTPGNRRQQKIDLRPGAYVMPVDESIVYRIRETIDFHTVLAVAVDSERNRTLHVDKLRSVETEHKDSDIHLDLEEIEDSDWQTAEKRFQAIRPLIHDDCGRAAVSRRAAELGIDTSTLYRWIERFNAIGVVTALIPKKRGWRKGKPRISAAKEAIIDEVIHDFYLTSQRPSAKKAAREIQRRCSERRLEAPSESTVTRRLKQLDDRRVLRGRGQRERAMNRYQPVPGRFPGADHPLAVVQIDHTPVDIILVDDGHRRAIGRPWITLAIDIYSRMVVGFYLSFDPPSETSVGLCIAHGICPKAGWLAAHGIDAEWPVWGFPQKIHVDNAAEFRSDGLRRSCLNHDIDIEFRPVKQPRYGGHIERLLGTLLQEIHDLPGTTFSSVAERDGYDSEKKAALTLGEFETWLAHLICRVYHQRHHRGIGTTPTAQWEVGIFGNSDIPGIGMLPLPGDELRVRLDFMPSFSRTIQRVGVTIDGLSYYDEALRHWIGAADGETGKTRQFVFRRDPRDISVLWFRDPEIGEYFRIPFANLALPSMSYWEHREIQARLKKDGRGHNNEHAILQALTELRDQVDASTRKTKSARRKAQRRKEHGRGTRAPEQVSDSDKAPEETSFGGLSPLSDEELDMPQDIS